MISHHKKVFVSKTPARISFSGGGTDLETYYKGRGSLVISTSIDKYFYAVLTIRDDKKIKIFSSDYDLLEEFKSVSEIKPGGILQIPKDIISFYEIDFGLDLFMSSDVPPGSGLGLSGAATVGIVKVFSAALEKNLSPVELAMTASEIEINRLKRPIGHQDQLASSFGGLNLIEFLPDCKINVTPLQITGETYSNLQTSLLLFYTGQSRDSAIVLEEHKMRIKRSDSKVVKKLDAIKDITRRMKDSLLTSDLHSFGMLLDEYWINKRKAAAGTSSEFFDKIYDIVKSLGALGGKLTGAGHGGFFLVFAEPHFQTKICKYIEEKGFIRYSLKFGKEGSKIL
ncbi:hypothetical protein KKB18_05445 [bacterium]|nr:hypothetical protein [bacterium]